MARSKRKNNRLAIFSTRLGMLIQEKGLSQAELSSELGMSRQALNSYVLGDTMPDIERLDDIASYFNVTYDFLMGKSESRKRKNLNITERIGLDDESIETLANAMQYGDYEKDTYVRRINKLLSCRSLVDSLLQFIGIEDSTGGTALTVIREKKYGLYHLTVSPDIYAATLLSQIQVILERLRTNEHIEEIDTHPGLRQMLDDYIQEREAKERGEHPQA